MTIASLETIRGSLGSIADAVRWACVLEATAPKPGNVHPSAAFNDLNYADFVVAAEITAQAITAQSITELSATNDSIFGTRLLNIVTRTAETTGTNVNLGIALLLNPLVLAVQSCRWSGRPVARDALSVALQSILQHINSNDSRLAFQAIRQAMAGGMKFPDDDHASAEMDMHSEDANHDDFLEAMRRASHRDQIAWEYANGFAGIFDDAVPQLEHHLSTTGDWLTAIQRTAIQLMSQKADSLIARKNGQPAAEQVLEMAQRTDPTDHSSVADLDRQLRSDGNRLNPGATADRISAAIFVLLVSDFD